jgi:hypothetical protein
MSVVLSRWLPPSFTDRIVSASALVRVHVQIRLPGGVADRIGAVGGVEDVPNHSGLGVLAGRMLLIVFSLFEGRGPSTGNRRAYRAVYPAEILVVLRFSPRLFWRHTRHYCVVRVDDRAFTSRIRGRKRERPTGLNP